MILPKSLTTVTTFSKLIALFLFILFPFAGFWLGLQYQQKLDSSKEAVNMNSNHTNAPWEPQYTNTQELNPTEAAMVQPLDASNWKTYTDTNLHFSISYPDNWTANGGTENISQGSAPFYSGSVKFTTETGELVNLTINFQGDDKCVDASVKGCQSSGSIVTKTGVPFLKFKSGQNNEQITYFARLQTLPSTTLILEGTTSNEATLDGIASTLSMQ